MYELSMIDLRINLKRLIFCYLIFNSFLSNLIFAATHPLTGSSIINQPRNSLAFTQMGFKLESIPVNWVYNKSGGAASTSIAASNIPSNTPSIIIQPTEPLIELGTENKTLLSFREEKVSVKTKLEQYVRQYLRDYNQYGFEITSLQSHIKSAVPSVSVDLSQKNKTTKSKQVFFHKQDKMIIATCADDIASFDQTHALCKQVLNSFKWR